MLRAHENQSERWLRLVGKVVDELKELGDVQNWVGVMSRDMNEVEAMLLERIERKRKRGP